MITVLASILITTAAVAMLCVGVIFGKRTPLKSSCHAPLDEGNNHKCKSCSCSNSN